MRTLVINSHRTNLFRRALAGAMAWLLAVAGLPMVPGLAQSPKQIHGVASKPVSSHARKRRAPAKANNHSKRELSFSSNPSDLEIFNARVFYEPLVPMAGKQLAGENKALGQALVAFKHKSKNNPEDITDLTGFLAAHPKSRWCSALELNIGQRRFETGYLTDALKYWHSAWELSKNETEQNRKAIADSAFAKMVALEARLGRTKELNQQLSEIGKRAFSGSQEAQVKNARDSLWAEEHHPEVAFKCGPFAVNELAKLASPRHLVDCRKTIKKAASISQGTNLAQVTDWAREVGLSMQVAKREHGADIVVPSVAHFTLGHFAAITELKNGKYHVKDPTFGEDGSRWVSAQALEAETDGYFLIGAGRLQSGWHAVDRREAAGVWGRGYPTSRDQRMTPPVPHQCLSSCCNGSGMAVASAFTMNTNLSIADHPLSYQPPVGPAMDMGIVYNYGQGNQPSVFTYSNLGANWNWNWVSNLSVDGSGDVTVNVRGGGYEVYESGSYSTPEAFSQATISTLSSGGCSGYQRQLIDGSTENFCLFDGTNYYMTEVVDPQGNQASIAYDGNYRLTSITDACGNTSTVTYISNTSGNAGFYKIATISDAFGRSASFAYDSTVTYLTSITDAAANVSQFFYDTSSSFITMMTTPYGSTSFYQYTPAGGEPDYPPVGLKVTYPDGTTAVVENWISEPKQTYYWDREATAQYPMDPANLVYSHCQSTRFLWNESNNQEIAFVNWTRKSLEAPIVYSYAGEFYQDDFTPGMINKPIAIQRAVAGLATSVTIAGPVTTGDQLIVEIEDPLIPYQEAEISYTVQAGDTLESIAGELAQAVSDNNLLQTYGITATPSGNSLTINSLSINSTYYENSSAGTTETIAFAYANPVETAVISGAVTAGGVLTLTVVNALLSGGQESVSYTVQQSDTFSSIAQNLSIAINADTNLQAINVSSSWTGQDNGYQVLMQSNSTAVTTYSSSTSSGATESISLRSPAFNSGTGIIQEWQYTRNSLGYITQTIDPLGRPFNYTYAENNIDLLQIEESAYGGSLIGQWAYNDSSAPHRPTSYFDGSGQETQYTYNTPYAELATITDANNNTTTLSYDADGYLTQIEGPLSGSDDVTTFTFYGYGLPETVTDSEGYQLVFSYDGLNRLTTTAFPDGTREQAVYSRLDSVISIDRLGRPTQRSFDRMDELISQIDPLGRKTVYCWCTCGAIAALTDPAGHTTKWNHDLEGRPIEKIYADQSSWSYIYSPTTGLLSSQTDALNQTKSWVYNLDNTLQYLGYANAVNATSPVQTAYDTLFPRVTSVTNGWGQLAYVYNPYAVNLTNTAYITIGGYPQTPNATDTISCIFTNSALSGGHYTMPTYSVLSGDAGNTSAVATDYAAAITSNATLSAAGISATANGSLVAISAGSTITVSPSATGSTTATLGGAGKLAQVTNNVIANSPISYSYDALERTVNRMIDGGNNNINWNYDAMSRVTSEANVLGTFNYTYVDDTPGSSKGTLRLKSIAYPNGQTTNFSWYPIAQDERLQQISNVTSSSALLSQFAYRYDSAGEITQWQQIQNNTSKFYQLAYDAAGQLTAAKAGNGTPAPNLLNQNYYAYDCAANRLAQQTSAIVNGAIGGSVTSGNSITITVADPALSGGSEAVTYSVQSGDTLSTISANLAAAITANSSLQAIGVNATSNGSNFSLRSCSNNITTYSESTSSGATETVALNRSANFVENAVVGGTKNTGDQLTITVYDPALSGGSQAISYTVLSSDTLNSIASGLKSAINANSALSALGVSATVASNVVTITSTSTNATTYAESISTGASETITLSINQNPTETVLIGGSLSAGDQLKLTVYDSGLSGGSETVSYTTASGNTPTNMATGLTSAINGDTNLQNLGVSAASSGPVITITSNSPNQTTYRNASASTITELISFGVPVNGTQTAAIGGSKTTSDQLNITVFDAGLSGGSKTDSYVVQSTDTLSSIASGLAAAINSDASLDAIGVSATAVSTVVNLNSTSVNLTTFGQSVSSGATETIALSPTTGVQQSAYNCLNELVSQSAGGNVLFQGSTARPITSAVINPNETVTIGGTITANDVLTLVVHNSALSHGEVVQYKVQSEDTMTSIATNLASNINADSILSGIGVSATSAGAVVTLISTSVNPTFYTDALSSGATETITPGDSSAASTSLAWSQSFSGRPVLASGSSAAQVTAISGGGVAKSNQYQINLLGGSSTSLTFDANGNMTSDGTNSYAWDAENRLIKITYPGSGNYSTFVYDGYGRNVDIIEYTSGSLSSTKQFVWCSDKMRRFQPCEARNGSGALTAQYFLRGQTISGISYFYDIDQLGSIRDFTNTSGIIEAQYAYDPFGRVDQIVSLVNSDFCYASYYLHRPSNLSLTATRAYRSTSGKWISRDPLGESISRNLFSYVGNGPIEFTDLSGLVWEFYVSADPVAVLGQHTSVIGWDPEQPGSWFDASAGPNSNGNWGKLTYRTGDNAFNDFAKQVCNGKQYPLKLPNGLSPEQFMSDAAKFGQAINQSAIPYNATPEFFPGTSNSNEFTTGLLQSENIGLPALNSPLIAPGYGISVSPSVP